MNGSFRIGVWLIEPQINTISGPDKATRVEPKVMQVLVCLAEHSGEVISKEKLIRQVWADTFVTDDVLTRCISELRKVFADDSKNPSYIQTIPRGGYRLIAPVHYEQIEQTTFRYQTISKIAEGGMGDVYLAQDTKLGRAVALKILPADVAPDEESRGRFLQEAKIAAALNHPNICVIHEVGETADRTPFIAMEYIEGQTLNEKIDGRPLEPYQVVEIGLQVADALSEAHSRGIVHRDVKPANIMITQRGVAKVLDFGLAKLNQSNGQDVVSAVGAAIATRQKIVTGTVPYMSPEHAQGEEVDHRTDTYSLGVVMYEMATGKRPFNGDTPADVFDQVLTRTPVPPRSINQSVPVELERIILRALERQRDRRYQSVAEFRRDLKRVKRHMDRMRVSTAVTAAVLSRPTSKIEYFVRKIKLRTFGLLVALTIMIMLPAGIAYFSITQRATDVYAIRTLVLPPERSTIGWFAISPDGRRLAIVATDSSGKSLLWLRPMNSLKAQPLSGTEGASSPFWSPDSRFIGFFAEGKLKKVEATGGHPQTLCEAPEPRGGAWGKDDTILFSPRPPEPLYRVSATGGEPTPATALDQSREERSHRWPQFLPDGRHFICWVWDKQAERRGIYVGSLDSKGVRQVMTSERPGLYAPPGYLLFLRDGALMAQVFDTASLRLSGEPVKLAERVAGGALGELSFSASNNGEIVYRSGAEPGHLQWVDRMGQPIGSPTPSRGYERVELSPDERHVVTERVNPETKANELWVVDLNTGASWRITVPPRSGHSPVWSSDGSHIAFASGDGIIQVNANGTGSELLLAPDRDARPSDWSADGRIIIYDRNNDNQYDLWMLRLAGSREPELFLRTQFTDRTPRFSPDGRWVAYVSNESGTWQVYVRSFPVPDHKRQVSTTGGLEPRWGRDGKELFYVAPDKRLMAVPVKTSPTFDAGVPKPILGSQSLPFAIYAQYAVSNDGLRFLIHLTNEGSESGVITLVQNWAAELRY